MPSSNPKQHPSENSICILALYHFLSEKRKDEQVRCLRDELETFLRQHEALGNILLATEGINGTICFPAHFQSAIQQYLLSHFPVLQTRVSHHPTNVFFRLKVRIKPEIVTMGIPVDPTTQAGTYVQAGKDWDDLIQDPTCLVIDTRNEYEYQVGTFRNAVSPNTQSFVEFPHWFEQQIMSKQANLKSKEGVKYEKVAMFCTGGIRCEKATSYCKSILQQDAQLKDMPVFHLKGGILAYLDQQQENSTDESLFEGECYVFDKRTAVQGGLKPTETYTLCFACRNPLTPEDRAHPDFEEGVSCHMCRSERKEKRNHYEERQRQIQLGTDEGHLRQNL